MKQLLVFDISEEQDTGIRVDVFVAGRLPEHSRSGVQKLIEEGNITINGKNIKTNYKTKAGDCIKVEIPEPVTLEVQPEDIELDIVFEDSDIAIINKPQGMVVHPAAGNYTGTLVNAILSKCSDLSGINGVIRPGIVHRIDKDTSGILVIAKNDRAHRLLSEQIKDHSMKRRYIALVEGNLKEDQGRIDQPIGRDPKHRKKMAIVKDGRNAITHYTVLERFSGYTLIEARLETGRTHQIRVHMASIGHPLVGDPVYGIKKQKFKLQGQALHARMLGFVHPGTGEYAEFSSALPLYFEELLSHLRKEIK